MESFTIYNGTRKIIISAPHAARHIRNGEEKYAEPETGIIAGRMQQCYDISCVVKEKDTGDDPNYDNRSEYRNQLQEYIIKHRIGLLFDLHELAPEREMDVCIGTGHGENIGGREDILRVLIEEFEKIFPGRVTVDMPFAASYENTVSASTARRCSIPCFQLEFNSGIFEDKTIIDKICAALSRVCVYWERNENAGMVDCKCICKE